MPSSIQRGNDQDANQSSQSPEIVQKKESTGPRLGQKSAIQAKQKPIQAKQKPVQAKHQTIQAKQSPIQRNSQKGTVQRNSPKGDDLKERMSAHYKVDLSGYQEHPNSSFPGTVGADATIQGKDIHYGPGKFTEQNRKHELGHAIDNTLNGTPKGDTVINGKNIDTTREKAAEKIENAPLPKSAEGETPTQMKAAQNSTGTVQAKFVDESNNQKLSDQALASFYNQFKQSKAFVALSQQQMSPQDIKRAFDALANSSDEIVLHKDGFFGVKNEKSFATVGESISTNRAEFQQLMKSPGKELDVHLEDALEVLPEYNFLKPLMPDMEDAWHKAMYPQNVGYFQAQQGFLESWGTCGMTNENILYGLARQHAEPELIKRVNFNGGDADTFANFLKLPVKQTTLIQISLPSMHEFTIEKRANGTSYMHQGFLSEFSGAWWSGAEGSDQLPYFSMDTSQPRTKDTQNKRDTWGKGQSINIGQLADKLAILLSKENYGAEAEEAWKDLPFPTNSGIHTLKSKINFIVSSYKLGDEVSARQNLEENGDHPSIVQSLMGQVQDILQNIEKHRNVRMKSQKSLNILQGLRSSTLNLDPDKHE